MKYDGRFKGFYNWHAVKDGVRDYRVGLTKHVLATEGSPGEGWAQDIREQIEAGEEYIVWVRGSITNRPKISGELRQRIIMTAWPMVMET